MKRTQKNHNHQTEKEECISFRKKSSNNIESGVGGRNDDPTKNDENDRDATTTAPSKDEERCSITSSYNINHPPSPVAAVKRNHNGYNSYNSYNTTNLKNHNDPLFQTYFDINQLFPTRTSSTQTATSYVNSHPSMVRVETECSKKGTYVRKTWRHSLLGSNYYRVPSAGGGRRGEWKQWKRGGGKRRRNERRRKKQCLCFGVFVLLLLSSFLYLSYVLKWDLTSNHSSLSRLSLFSGNYNNYDDDDDDGDGDGDLGGVDITDMNSNGETSHNSVTEAVIDKRVDDHLPKDYDDKLSYSSDSSDRYGAYFYY